ncbi:MAG TPA: AraC family transcriptional regulator, partial [Terrimicrobiaceae bacterium]|nr:AraC family transcriptional regulator [Terrimicrobiaceae bacterium]
LTQWPGEHVEYGPADGESWDELYLIYDAQLLPRFRTAGFIDLRRPVWPISHPPAVGKRIADLHALSHSDSPENAADRADRTAEWLILETHSPPPVSRIDAGILRASEEIRNNPAGPVDFSALAKRCGMSLSTFRRRWQHAFGMPPGQSLLQLRMHEACRLLTETRLPVGEVARLSGFDDEFYFSRRFRLRLQATPTKYRQLFHSRPS